MPLIQHTSKSIMWASVIVSGVGASAAAAVTPLAVRLQKLDIFAQFLLTTSPSIGPIIIQTPMAMLMKKPGRGVWTLQLVAAVCVCASLLLFGLSFHKALFEIESMNDPFYWLVFTAGVLAGCGNANFLSIILVYKCFPAKSHTQVQSLYTGIGEAMISLSLLVIQILSKLESFTLAYAALIGLQSLGLLVALLGLRYPNEAPVVKPLSHKGEVEDSDEGAKRDEADELDDDDMDMPAPLPLERGASTESTQSYGSDCSQKQLVEQNFCESLFDARTWAAVSANAVAYGGFLAFALSFPLVLRHHYGFGALPSVVITSFAGIFSDVVRSSSGTLMERYDKSRGPYTYSLGALLTICGCVGLGVIPLSASLAFVILFTFVQAAGIGLASSTTFSMVSVFGHVDTKEFPLQNLAVVNGIVTPFGALSGVLFSVIFGVIARLPSAEGRFAQAGVIAGCNIVSAMFILLVNWRVKVSNHDFDRLAVKAS